MGLMRKIKSKLPPLVFVPGGLDFNLSDIATDTPLKSNTYLLAALKNLVGSDFDALGVPKIESFKQWYVQAGDDPLNAITTTSDNTVILGGTGNDTLAGGTGNDLLIGNAGDDSLEGGQGNDILLGGTGDDTYTYATDDGTDTILDKDSQGSITYDGITLTGGDQYGDAHVHKDANHHLYVQVDADTLIVDGNIIVEGYIAGNGALGITMEDPAAEADIPVITGNDQDNFIGTAVYNRDADGNFVSEANAVDDGGHPGGLLGRVYTLVPHAANDESYINRQTRRAA